jgi:hypothetical protein
MMTNDDLDRVRGWFTGRLPEEWKVAAPDVTVDREEITVVLTIADPATADGAAEGASEVEADEARVGRVSAFREDTRGQRMTIADEAQHRFERKVSWGVRIAGIEDQTALFTHVSAPVMTRLRQPQRQVLDTLVDAGVARSRADALAWCVRLVGQHEDDWLAELRQAMESVADVRAKGPAA